MERKSKLVFQSNKLSIFYFFFFKFSLFCIHDNHRQTIWTFYLKSTLLLFMEVLHILYSGTLWWFLSWVTSRCRCKIGLSLIYRVFWWLRFIIMIETVVVFPDQQNHDYHRTNAIRETSFLEMYLIWNRGERNEKGERKKA